MSNFGLAACSSLAVVGASSVPGKWGYLLADGALRGEGRRSVYLVNRKGGEILGRMAHASVAVTIRPPFVVAAVPVPLMP